MTGRTRRPGVLLVVDAANVVGSVPDGWWRNRAGAAARLRDSLVRLADDPPDWLGAAAGMPVEIALVVEGAAVGIRPVGPVRVVSARGSGDDAVVDLVRGRPGGRRCVVVTADRELRERVRELGAEVVGPRSVWPAAVSAVDPAVSGPVGDAARDSA